MKFLKGLNDTEMHKTLTAALERGGIPININEGGEMTMTCLWNDAVEIMKRAGEGTSGNVQKRQRRMLIRPEDIAAGIEM